MQKLDFYQDFRERMRKWLESDSGKTNKYAEFLMFAPDLFHLLCKLSLDPEVPVRDKAKLAGAVAYFVAPIDLIPEALTGPIGYADDIAVASFVLNGLVNETNEHLVKKHWAGDEDVLQVIRKIIGVADEMVGGGVWQKLKKRFR